jgi:hypothetical protein
MRAVAQKQVCTLSTWVLLYGQSLTWEPGCTEDQTRTRREGMNIQTVEDASRQWRFGDRVVSMVGWHSADGARLTNHAVNLATLPLSFAQALTTREHRARIITLICTAYADLMIHRKLAHSCVTSRRFIWPLLLKLILVLCMILNKIFDHYYFLLNMSLKLLELTRFCKYF